MTSKQGYKAKLDQYFEKNIIITLQDKRKIKGRIVGYDEFMNICLDNAVEIKDNDIQNPMNLTLVRGNSIVSWECIEKVDFNIK